MRCPYCHQLIIHRFNHNYTKRDRERKRRHMKRCPERPDDDTEPTYTEYNP